VLSVLSSSWLVGWFFDVFVCVFFRKFEVIVTSVRRYYEQLCLFVCSFVYSLVRIQPPAALVGGWGAASGVARDWRR